jgi:hypothetical protein
MYLATSMLPLCCVEKSMYFSEKISCRLKSVYIGIAMGIAIWLLYTSYLVLTNSIRTNTSMSSVELVLTPIALSQK